MAAAGRATFVGFGFGAIQVGLFCLEAMRSGVFRRLVVAEVLPEVVAAVRANGGQVVTNVAYADHLEAVPVGSVALENPEVDADRARLVEAIAAAQAVATAVPSVRAYRGRGPGSLHRVLAAGLLRKVAVGGPRAVVYVAENQPEAAALLRAAVMEEIPAGERAAVGARVAFVDMVIAKMSGFICPAGGLTPLTPGSDRALLVESFNRIQVARPEFGPDAAPFVSSFPTFHVEADLVPFERAKFFAHNGVHALGAYLGMTAGLATMSDLGRQPGMVEFLRAALLDEVGTGLMARYAGAAPLFTPAGLAAYADDLLARIVNPYLQDGTARVGRDPERKLGWDDRLVGAMRLAYAAGVVPRRFALGTAAAVLALGPAVEAGVILPALWRADLADPAELATMLDLVRTGVTQLRAWRAAGFPDLNAWWAAQPG
jgi:mannitol-1-phosphate 5-dehydrogenase